MADVIDGQPRVVRRKFATPPVKLACLSCRASRTRCDGGRPCASCVTKGNECAYRPSRRGGPRIRKKTASNSPPLIDFNIMPPETADVLLPEACHQPVALQNYIDPGAALGQLPDMPQDSDYIFDSLFSGAFSANVFDGAPLPQNLLEVPQKSGPLVRTYRSDRTLLQAYYCWIHPFVPIFPPPETAAPVDEPYSMAQNRAPFDEDFEPSTPVALALSAVLALIPCPEDTDPSAPESVLFRRKCAQFFAQSAIESIEAEAEIPDSATEPHKALESTPPPADRAPFHPRVPIELESIIALNLLSIYEYAQRGNLKKMRSRAGQALVDAMMTFSLHAQTDDNDYYAEAKRRVWWITYMCATQSSIVSSTPPPLELYNATFTTKYPTLDVDPEAWPVFIEAQQAILTATQFVIELTKVLASNGDMDPIYRKMVELENRFAPMIERSEAWTFNTNLAHPVDPAETCLVRTLKSMARIKLNSARVKIHRYCAFYDLPVFTKRHCDLKSIKSEASADGFEPLPWPTCSCSSQGSLPSVNGSGSTQPSYSAANSTAMSGSPASSAHASSLGSPAGMSDTTPPMMHANQYHQHGGQAHNDFGTVAGAGGTASMASSMTSSSMAGGMAGSLGSMTSMTGSSLSSSLSSLNNMNGVNGMNNNGLNMLAGMANSNAGSVKVPFSSHLSAKICLRSALNIAAGFDGLPYPNPTGQFGMDVCFLSTTSPIVAPRMLPSFVCCAMQGAYVFLSIYRKIKAMQQQPVPTSSANEYLVGMLLQLQQGLTSILAALENYATAFEALRSMRDQIKFSADTLMGLEAYPES